MRNSKIFKPGQIIALCEEEISRNGNHLGIFNFRQRRLRNNKKKQLEDKEKCKAEEDFYFRNLEINTGGKWVTIKLLILNYKWVTRPLKSYDMRDEKTKNAISFGIPYDTTYENNNQEHHVGKAVEYISEAMEYYIKLEKEEGYIPADYGRRKISAIHETENDQGETSKWIGIKINKDKNKTGPDGSPCVKGTFIDGEKSSLDTNPKIKVPYTYTNPSGEEEPLTTMNIENWCKRYMRLAIMVIELQTVSVSLLYQSQRGILDYSIRYDPEEQLDVMEELEADGEDLTDLLSGSNKATRTLKPKDNDNTIDNKTEETYEYDDIENEVDLNEFDL